MPYHKTAILKINSNRQSKTKLMYSQNYILEILHSLKPKIHIWATT